MRSSRTRKSFAVIATILVAATTFIAAGASAATIVIGAIDVVFGPSFPDAMTWGLMLASFGVIAAGVRSRKRSVVIA